MKYEQAGVPRRDRAPAAHLPKRARLAGGKSVESAWDDPSMAGGECPRPGEQVTGLPLGMKNDFLSVSIDGAHYAAGDVVPTISTTYGTRPSGCAEMLGRIDRPGYFRRVQYADEDYRRIAQSGYSSKDLAQWNNCAVAFLSD
jgi:hypothetical protein